MKNFGNVQKHIPYNPNAICDVCGRKRKWSEVTLAYGTGDLAVIVSCIDGCADYRHPLNSPPPTIYDGQPVPNARPENTDTFVSSTTSAGQTWNGNTYKWSKPQGEFDFNFVNDNINWENS